MRELLENYNIYLENLISIQRHITDLTNDMIYIKASKIDGVIKGNSISDPTYDLAREHIEKEKLALDFKRHLKETQKIVDRMDNFIASLQQKDRILLFEVYKLSKNKKFLTEKYEMSASAVNKWLDNIFKKNPH